jgi:hypothetical protein
MGRGLILLLGESFRLGGQGTRDIGSYESYPAQIQASKTHIKLIEHLETSSTIDLYVSTYPTIFTSELLQIYKKYMVGYTLHDTRIGIHNLFHTSIHKIENKDIYDFICFIRIDAFLKDSFIHIFNPRWSMIMFPSICFIPHHRSGNHPRVNDIILFIPKKYYRYIYMIPIGHEMWQNLVDYAKLSYDDLDTMLTTFHDSDSAKDFNPLYYIVNRPESTVFHSQGYIFNKKLPLP